MAKQGKRLPARRQRKQTPGRDSVLLRSAESIGRVIGTLQRQLDGARERFAGSANGATTTGQAIRRRVVAKRKVKAAATPARRRTSTTSTKAATRSTATRKSVKRTRTSR